MFRNHIFTSKIALIKQSSWNQYFNWSDFAHCLWSTKAHYCANNRQLLDRFLHRWFQIYLENEGRMRLWNVGTRLLHWMWICIQMNPLYTETPSFYKTCCICSFTTTPPTSQWSTHCKLNTVFNLSAWGHLNHSSYCDVGRLFYGVFKLWSKLQSKKWRNNF
jgi:hypothetical protein